MQMVNKIISKAHKQSKTLPREPDRLEQPAFGLATASLQPGGAYMDQTAVDNPE